MARYSLEFRKGVGRMLLANPGSRQRIIARELDVTDRTIRHWKGLARKENSPRPGPKEKGITFLEVLQVAREWHRQEFPGYRPVVYALPGVRVRAVKVIVAQMKLRKKQRHALIRKMVQVRVRVKKPGTVVTMDGATVRKGEDYVVYRDRGSTSTRADYCGGPLRSENTLDTLKGLKDQGRLPLVVCTDNGSPFCANVVEDFMVKNYIVHLKSLPRVPQHNGSCENAVKEFKELFREGYQAEEACEILNERRKRRGLNYLTSNEFDRENFQSYTDEDRIIFFNAAKAAIEVAQLGTRSVYERRKAEREAIFQTMEDFSLITRTRGGRPCASGPEESLCSPQ